MFEHAAHWLIEVLRAQTFRPADIPVVLLLVLLEGVLSVDNALVLGLQVKRLPEALRSKALTYGLIGAVVFRLIAVALAAWLLQSEILRLIGGAYLVFLAVRHFLLARHNSETAPAGSSVEKGAGIAPARPHFWRTVLTVELTDIAFAIDSILAAVAMVTGSSEKNAGAVAGAHEKGVHPKLWIVVAGGILGVILMRFAAIVFLRLVRHFPRLETSAYLLVLIVGVKMLIEWAGSYFPAAQRLDFHDSHSPAFWGYWALMIGAVASGFLGGRAKSSVEATGC